MALHDGSGTEARFHSYLAERASALGRVARVKFDEAGLYTVTAVLTVDGKETRRETVDIRVKPIQ